MTSRQVLPVLIVVAASLGGCSTEQGGATLAVDSGGDTETTRTEPTTLSQKWACSPSQVSHFATDPVVYPSELALTDVASRLDGKTFHIDSNSGRVATVTFRNDGGFIVRSLEFARSETVGWHIERGRSC